MGCTWEEGLVIGRFAIISGQWMMVATNRAGSHESETWVSLGSTQRLSFLKILHDHPRKNHLPWCERDGFVWRGPSPIFLDHALAQQQGKFHIGNHLFVAGLKCSDLLQACHERRDPDLIGRIRKKVAR